MKQRKLLQWGAAYVAAVFASLEGIGIIAQQFGWSAGLQRGITLALVLGLFVVLVLAWYHGERGEQKVSRIELLILTILLLAGGGLMWHYALTSTPAPAPAPARLSGSPDAPAPTAPVPREIPDKSIAVLPLVNDSGDKGQQYFSDGLSEDLITALSQFGGLKVISRNSAFQFRDSKENSRTIGAKLGVAHLLEGSVRRDGGVVRISAALVTAADGTTTWSRRYDRPYKDLFTLQDEITTAVATALQAELLAGAGASRQSDRPRSGKLDAYNAYLQGNFHRWRDYSEASTRKAIDFYRQAIHLDPRYAYAYASEANAVSWHALVYLDGMAKRQAYDVARRAANKALALNPDLAAAHLAMGTVLTHADLDWSGAEAQYRRAMQLAPNDSDAILSVAQSQATIGHPQAAVDLVRRALTTDTLNMRLHFYLADFLMPLGHLDEAEQQLRRANALQPAASFVYLSLVKVQLLRGDADGALDTALKTPAGPWKLTALADARQIGSDRAAADAALQNLIDKDPDSFAYRVAQVYALRKDPERMFQWLDRAWDNRDTGIGWLLYDPYLKPYQHDPRFAAFCSKVGLPTPEAIAAGTQPVSKEGAE